MCLYSDGTNLFASVGKDDSAYVSKDGGNNWIDISDGLHHYIKCFSNHNGKLFATQWDTDSSIVQYNSEFVTSIISEKKIIHNFALYQNYPNPFNPETKITYQIAKQGDVRLEVYNTLGQKIQTLVNRKQPTGQYSVNFNATGLASGIYYYVLFVDSDKQTRKMLLNK
jgi:hypothetical protein